MAHTDEEHSEAQLLKLLLAARDIPCPVCGYNLRAIASTNCPECGAKLDLRVGSTDLKLGPWLTVVLGAALPLGFTLIMTVLLAGIAAVGPVHRELVQGIAYFGTFALAYASVLVLIVRKRRTFLRRRKALQVLLATGCLFLNLLFVVGLVVLEMWS